MKIVAVSSEKIGLFRKLHAVMAEPYKSVEEFSVVCGAFDRVKEFVPSLPAQSVEALHAFIKHNGTELMGQFYTKLEGVYNGCGLSCPYILTCLSTPTVTTVEVRRPTTRRVGDVRAADSNVPVPASPKPRTPPI